ncbi:MAG: radical SAM protein [Deltaproteobacteria bacterium]|nr:radical SAM protein [Deltaproteobacteria bacterium]
MHPKKNTLYDLQKIDYALAHVIWKITLGCNFRCIHCGFAAGKRDPNELTLEEALDVCDQLKELQAENVVLTGGEPLLRKDWPLLAKRLSSGTDRVDKVHIVSNGWTHSDRTYEQFLDSGVSQLTLSIDGNRQVHDRVRGQGSFDRVVNAMKLANKWSFPFGVITTVHKLNLPILDELFAILSENQVVFWQLELADGVGYMDVHRDFMIAPSDLELLSNKMIEFLERSDGKMQVVPGNNLGYFTEEDRILRGDYFGGCYTGCFAGIFVMSIEPNGDIRGCPVLPKEFGEGNVRKQRIRDIWLDKNKFSYNRQWDVNSLSGFCGGCEHSLTCRGGCMASRIGAIGDLSHNLYCLYRVKKEKENGRTLELPSHPGPMNPRPQLDPYAEAVFLKGRNPDNERQTQELSSQFSPVASPQKILEINKGQMAVATTMIRREVNENGVPSTSPKTASMRK